MRLFAFKREPQIPGWPLWSLLWRLLLFGPILMTIGALMLTALIASILVPPFYAVILAMEGHYMLGALVIGTWIAWLPWARRLSCWMMQGIEYSSI